MRDRSPANSAASSPPVPARISTITSLSSFGSAGEHAGADLLAELVEQPAALAELLLGELAELVVAVAIAVAGQDLLGSGDVPLRLAVARHQLVGLGELGVAARRRGVARPVAEHVGVGELPGELVVAAFDLVDEAVDT